MHLWAAGKSGRPNLHPTAVHFQSNWTPYRANFLRLMYMFVKFRHRWAAGKSSRPNLDPTAVDELELCFRKFAPLVFVRFRGAELPSQREDGTMGLSLARPRVSAATGRRRQTTSAYGPSIRSHVHLPILGLACPLAVEIALSRVNIKQSAISLSPPLWSFLLSSSTFAPSLSRS